MGKVKCAWASQDENGKARGGATGDQTKKEVKVGEWYDFGQSFVIRCKDEVDGAVIAEVAVALAQNDCIGYDQGDRTSLYEELKKLDWDYNKLKTKCETDCSAFAAVCCNVAGIAVSKDVYSGNIVDACKKTGKFLILTDKKYLTSDIYLKEGDILVAPGHHVIVCCADGSKVKSDSDEVKPEPSKSNTTVSARKQYFSMYIGTSSSIIDALADVGCKDTSLTYRKKIALANSVKNYTGSAEQNTALLHTLKHGHLIRP